MIEREFEDLFRECTIYITSFSMKKRRRKEEKKTRAFKEEQRGDLYLRRRIFGSWFMEINIYQHFNQ